MTDQYYTRHRPRRERKDQERYSVTFTPAPTPAAPAAPPPPPNPTEREAWNAAYGDKPITLDAAHWDDRGYMVWKAPTNARGSRLAFSRNFANPTND